MFYIIIIIIEEKQVYKYTIEHCREVKFGEKRLSRVVKFTNYD